MNISELRRWLLSDGTDSVHAPILWAATRKPWISAVRYLNVAFGVVNIAGLALGIALGFVYKVGLSIRTCVHRWPRQFILFIFFEGKHRNLAFRRKRGKSSDMRYL